MTTPNTQNNDEYYILCGNVESGGGYRYVRTNGDHQTFVNNGPFDTFSTAEDAQKLADILTKKHGTIYSFEVGAF